MNNSREPEFQDYLKAACLNQYNLIASGGVLIFALMSGTLGVFIPIWLGVEVLVIIGLATNRKFQLQVQENWEQAAYERQEALLFEASDDYQQRYLDLKERYEAIQAAAAANDATASITVWQPEIDKLHYVLSSFIRLAHYRSNLEQMNQSFEKHVLNTKIEEVERKLKSASDRLQPQYQKYIDILRQRIDKGEKIAETSEAIRVQLNIIEEQFKLIQHQIYLVKNPEELTDQLDFLVSGIDALQNQGNLLMSMQAELDAFVIPPPPNL